MAPGRGSPKEPVDVSRLQGQAADLPVVFILIRHRRAALPEPSRRRSHQHLLASLWAPEPVGDHQEDAVWRMGVVPAERDTPPQNTTERKARGPFIPWLKPRGCLAHVL